MDMFDNDGTDWENNMGDRMALINPVHNMEYFNDFIDTLIGIDELVEPLEDDYEDTEL